VISLHGFDPKTLKTTYCVSKNGSAFPNFTVRELEANAIIINTVV